MNACESHVSLARQWLSPPEASQRISSRRISERSNYAAKSCANLLEKLPKKSFEPYSNSSKTCSA